MAEFVMVYTNGAERALRLALMLGGVSVGKEIFRYDPHAHITEHWHRLRKMLEDDGFVFSVLGANTYVFVYSEQMPLEPYRMVDYDPSYKDVHARPVPFPANCELKYKINDLGLSMRMPVYFGFLQKGVSYIINAATDDLSGEQAFFGFREMLVDSCDKSEDQTVAANMRSCRVFRARFTSMSQQEVRNAFTILDGAAERMRTMYAAVVSKEIDWLISANSSNLLLQKTGLPLVVGRVESALLSLLAGRDAELYHSPAEARAVGVLLEASVRDADGTLIDMTFPQPAFCKELFAPQGTDLEEIQKNFPKELFCSKVEIIRSADERVHLYNVFTLQADAAARLGLSICGEIIPAIRWLYDEGYITWPSDIDSIPWRLRTNLSVAAHMLAKHKELCEAVVPNAVENFATWDKETSEDASEAHAGILITGKEFDVQRITGVPAAIYKLICERISHVLNNKLVSLTAIVEAELNGIHAVMRENLQYDEYQPSEQELEERSRLSMLTNILAGDELRVRDVVLAEEPAKKGPYTEFELIKEALPYAHGSYINDIGFFSRALENLISWKLVARGKGMTLSLTERGRDESFYLTGTSLFDPHRCFDWDRRLKLSIPAPKKVKDPDYNEMVSLPDTRGIRTVEEDIALYIDDLAEELEKRVDSMGGMNYAKLSACRCPRCRFPVRRKHDGSGWACNNIVCNFSLPAVHFGHELTWEDVSDVLSGKDTARYTDFVSQSKGKPFSGRLHLNDKGVLSVSFQSQHKCFNCGSILQEWDWGLKCAKCGWSLNGSICGVKLTDDMLDSMLQGDKTELIRGFISANTKKPFSAKLYLENGIVKFNFQNDMG